MMKFGWFLASGLAVGAIAAVVYAMLSGSGDDAERDVDSDWGFFPDAASLVRHSEVIVLATAGDATRQATPLISPATGELTGERIDEIRDYTVQEALKGDGGHGTIRVRNSVSLRDRLASGGVASYDSQPPDVRKGRDYVLFLRRADDDPGVWVPAGLPWIAVDTPATLVFKLSKEQATGLRESHVEPGPSGAGSGLALTLSQLRELVRNPGPAPSGSDTTSAPGELGPELATLLSELPSLPNDAAVSARLAELGLNVSGLNPQACYKIQGVIRDHGFTLDLGCPR